ncbi:hypothetical protein N8521_03585, partial [Akkermansiaceae bacterium]|nr:hypothetical protein [Akkermansiaceae bacterium]
SVVVVVFRIEYFLVIKGYNPQLGEKAHLLQNYYYRLAAARILFLDSSPLAPVSRFRVKGSGIRVQWAILLLHLNYQSIWQFLPSSRLFFCQLYHFL